MSMELHTFLLMERCPTQAQWQAAVEDLSLPISIDSSGDPLSSEGFLPVEIDGENSGFEIYRDNLADVAATLPNGAAMIGERNLVLSFRYAAAEECACAYGAAAALIKAFGAITCCPEDGTWYQTPEEAIAVVTECLQQGTRIP